MVRRYAPLFAPLQNRMHGDQFPVLEYANFVGERVDFNQSASGGIRDAVGIAADADHALSRDPALQLQDRAEWSQREGPQIRPLFGESLVDDTQCGGMGPRIGDRIQPVP